jgi:hypothetical protein
MLANVDQGQFQQLWHWSIKVIFQQCWYVMVELYLCQQIEYVHCVLCFVFYAVFGLVFLDCVIMVVLVARFMFMT